MENTRFLRKYLSFMHYDKPHNSLPIILISINVFSVLINCFTAIRVEEDVEKFLLAVPRFVMNILLLINVFNHSFNPSGIMRLIEYIEDDFIVGQNDFTERKEKWIEIEAFYERKRKIFRAKCQYLVNIMIMLSFGIILERPMNLFIENKKFRIESGDWPTPHVSYTPAGLENWQFFCYLLSSQCITVIVNVMEGYLMLCSIWMSTEKLIADFETIYILLESIALDYPVENENVIETSRPKIVSETKTANLKNDMRLVVACHQQICKNANVCADNASFMVITTVTMIVLDTCFNAYRTLQSGIQDYLHLLQDEGWMEEIQANNVKGAVNFVILFILVNLTVLYIFNNGQLLFNQNEILRRHLTELPWTDKPRWFRQSVYIMMTRANNDVQLKPYGIFVLNLMSFKEVMKFILSSANVLYTMKHTSKSF